MEPMRTTRINRMTDIVCDGTKIGFRMHFADGTDKAVHLSAGDAGKFVTLILSELARKTPPTPVPPPASSTPIPAIAIAQAPAPAPLEGTLTAVHLGLFQLAFQTPS